MIREFIYKYYIDPIRYGQPYNIVDTLTYAVILIICLFLISRWLTRSRIPIDNEFVYALIPWIILGGMLRVVEDTGVLDHDLGMVFTTPLIFFFMFAIAAPTVWIAWKLERLGIVSHFKKSFFLVGIVLSGITLSFLVWYGYTQSTFDTFVGGIIVLMAAGASILMYAVLRYLFNWEFVTNRLYQLLIFGQMLDASATSYGIDIHPLHYVEQHVVGSFLIKLTGTAFVMFPLKILVIIPGIWVLEQYWKSEYPKIWFYLIVLAMIVVGMAPGIRDMMRMVLYV